MLAGARLRNIVGAAPQRRRFASSLFYSDSVVVFAIGNRNDKYIAPSFFEQKKEIKKHLNFTNRKKRTRSMFNGYATSADVTTPFCKAKKPSISTHARWLIYFNNLFFLLIFFFLILWQQKKTQQNLIIHHYKD